MSWRTCVVVKQIQSNPIQQTHHVSTTHKDELIYIKTQFLQHIINCLFFLPWWSSLELALSRLEDFWCPEWLEWPKWSSHHRWAGLRLRLLVTHSASLISVFCFSILSYTGDSSLADTCSNRGLSSLLALSAVSTTVSALLVLVCEPGSPELASSWVAGGDEVVGMADATGADGSVSGTGLKADGSVWRMLHSWLIEYSLWDISWDLHCGIPGRSGVLLPDMKGHTFYTIPKLMQLSTSWILHSKLLEDSLWDYPRGLHDESF